MSSNFHYREFLTLSLSLSLLEIKPGATPKENIKRLVANRTYYGALHGTRQYLIACEKVAFSQDRVESFHSDVWTRFKDPKWSHRRRVFDASTTLKKFREWADYNDPAKPAPSSVQEVWDGFKELQEALIAVMGGTDCSQDPWILKVDCLECCTKQNI